MSKIIFIYYRKQKHYSEPKTYKKYGPDIFEASNFDNIISIAKAEAPDLIVLDTEKHKWYCQIVAQILKGLHMTTGVVATNKQRHLNGVMTHDQYTNRL